MEPLEPRTNTDILRDLLPYAQEQEWVSTFKKCRRGCCGDWIHECSECGAEDPGPSYGDDPKEDTQDKRRKHREGCRLESVLREAEAFLRIEDAITERRAET